MAQYKVPQDVEADDKLLGPFSFRQFVYLLICAGLIALAVLLFRLFPLLVIIPIPFILLFGALALPLKKDQPMETYLSALVSYYLKPHKRLWTPGQRESTIEISAPKIVEDDRTRDISGEEATHRLSFLADIVDTEGQAIRNEMNNNFVNEDLVTEANTVSDIFETRHFDRLENTIARDENERHAEVLEEMRRAISQTESFSLPTQESPKIERFETVEKPAEQQEVRQEAKQEVEEKIEEKVEPLAPKPSIIELANNDDFSVATIAKEAERIKEKEDGEVFISLH